MVTVNYSRISRIMFTITALIFTWSDTIGYEKIDIKYIALGLNSIMLLLLLIYDRKGVIELKKLKFYYELKQLLIIAGVFAIVSAFFQIKNGEFKFFVIKDLLYLVTPMIYVFLLTNIDNVKNKDYYFRVALLFVTAEFFYRYYKIFNLKNILSISFIDSYSPFESNIADIFLLLFVYFLFTNTRFLSIVSAFLCYLTFKRTHVAIIIFCVLFKKLLLKNKTVNPKIIKCIKVFFIVAPFIIMFIFSDPFAVWFKSVFKMDLNEFTMSRFTLIMRVIKDDTFINYGFGSTTEFLTMKYWIGPGIRRFMHNDILRVYIECGFIGSIVFANNYINIAKKNLPSLMIMLSFFTVMFISHILTLPYSWIIGLLAISSFNEISENAQAIEVME